MRRFVGRRRFRRTIRRRRTVRRRRFGRRSGPGYDGGIKVVCITTGACVADTAVPSFASIGFHWG